MSKNNETPRERFADSDKVGLEQNLRVCILTSSQLTHAAGP